MQNHYDAQEMVKPFKLLILDLTIPGGMGRIEPAQQIRNRDKNVFLTAISGYSKNPVMCDPQAYNFNASLSKTFRTSDFMKLISSFLYESNCTYP